MRSRIVYGAGLNDSGYRVYKEERVNGKRRQTWVCPFYMTWKSMLERCFSKKFQEKWPAYKGATICAEWLTFSVFKQWMLTQDWEGNHPDKDILSPGNKHYSPEFCVFVSPALNMFLTDSAASRGAFPIGVHFNKTRGKYAAQCRNPFDKKKTNLGLFDTPESAHLAWLSKKREIANMYASQQKDHRIANALRKRYSETEYQLLNGGRP